MPTKRKKAPKDEISSFLKEINKPFGISYKNITSEQEAIEISRAKKALDELRKSGFDLNAQIEKPELSGTVLHFAANAKRIYFIKVLIEAGVDINAVNAEGRTALHIALVKPYSWTLACITLLIENGAHINAADNEGLTPLDMCALPLMKQHKSTINYLLEMGATYGDSKAFMCNLAVQIAKNRNYKHLLKAVNKAVINEADNDGRTILHYAASFGEPVQFFLDKKADVNIVDNYGRTALHYALLRGETKNITLLFKETDPKFKSLNFRDVFGNNILHFLFTHIAEQSTHISVYGTDVLSLLSNCLDIFNNNEILKLVLEENNQYLTPLQFITTIITTYSMPDDLKIVGKKLHLESWVEQQKMSPFEKSYDSYIYTLTKIFLSLHKLIDDKELADEVETKILRMVCYNYPRMLAKYMLPNPGQAPNDVTSYEYIAHKILNLKIPFEERSPFVTNAIIYQTCLIKNAVNTLRGVKREIYYGPGIVFELFEGSLSSNLHISFELAGAISLFLDNYTLNIVLPQVHPNCARVSNSIIQCQNKLTFFTDTGNEELIGEKVNNYLWNGICHSFLSRQPQSCPYTDDDVKNYSDATYEQVGAFLECRGVPPAFTYSRFKVILDNAVATRRPAHLAANTNTATVYLLKSLLSAYDWCAPGYDKIYREFESIISAIRLDQQTQATHDSFQPYVEEVSLQTDEDPFMNRVDDFFSINDDVSSTIDKSDDRFSELFLKEEGAITTSEDLQDKAELVSQNEMQVSSPQHWFNSPIHTARNSGYSYFENSQEKKEIDNLPVDWDELETIFDLDEPETKRSKLE